MHKNSYLPGMHRAMAVAVAVAVGTMAGGCALDLGETSQGLAGAGPRYDQVQQKSSHNSYQRHEALLDQILYHRLRSLELDIHNSKGTSGSTRDWFVYHSLLDSGTTCHKLSDCLTDIAALDQAVPDHELVTLWIDLKSSFDSNHQPADLDALLTSILGADALVTPRTLMDACPGATSLIEAVTGTCAWPALETVRSQYMVVLTGGDLSDPQGKLSTYLHGGGNPHDRVAFVAPDLISVGGIGADPDVIFHNMNVSDRALAVDVFGAGLVGRVWGVNTQIDWSATQGLMAHHIATDKVSYHQDPWAVTHDSVGWPFTCLDSCDSIAPEPAQLTGMRIQSGDIWNSTDSFMFVGKSTPAEAHSLSGFVSTANSHVHEWAKGCLMARQSTDARAPYFAVCRPADEHKLRVQYRTSTGGSTSAVEASITASNTIDHESVMFVRLDLDAARTCATGYGSQDGVAWTRISGRCFSSPLAIEGLAASSHGSGTVTFLFGGLTRTGTGTEFLSTTSFDAPRAIGSGASGIAYDGWRP